MSIRLRTVRIVGSDPERFWNFFSSLPANFQELFTAAFCGSWVDLESEACMPKEGLPEGHKTTSSFMNGNQKTIRTNYQGIDVRYHFCDSNHMKTNS